MAAARESILYYSPDEISQLSRLTGVMFRMKVRIRKVQPEELGKQVGYLIGMKDFLKNEEPSVFAASEPDGRVASQSGVCAMSETEPCAAEKTAIVEEMLVFNNFSSSRLNEVLDKMKKAGVKRIDLKAMVTPTNRSWTFYDLYQEIKEEHETLSQPTEEKTSLD